MTNETNDTSAEIAGFTTDPVDPTPIHLVQADELDALRESLGPEQALWLDRQGFHAKPGEFAFADGAAGAAVYVGWDGKDNLASLGGLPTKLPEADYTLASAVTDLQLTGWGLGAYQFTRYRPAKRAVARLEMPASNDADKVHNTTLATALARDLINTSAADMAPSHLAAEATALADMFGASIELTTGDELLDRGCGAIHAVGRAAEDPPLLIDMTWGEADAPKVTLVGKGVTFDSGGLDLKPASGMRLMKKDMGGAATVLGLAYLIMAQALPVRLRVLVPAAENAVSGNAFRPGDVLHTHKGLTVEIDNTDAEGRLLLCDALSIACEESPELIFDYATLTGSARSAVGTEIAAMFANADQVAVELGLRGNSVDDTVWHMPLHQPYRHMLDSKVADTVNSAASPYAGSITAALFLEKFVSDTKWVHFDIMAFNTRSRPGRPEGGEAMGLRAVYQYLEDTYG